MKLLIPNIRQYIISCTLLSVVLLASCEENDIAKVKAMFDEKEVDVEVADSVQFIYKEDQYARAVVTGKTVKRYTRTQNKLEFTDGLIVRFYDQLKLISVLKADFAENNDSEQKVLVSGNVYMESAKYERMETQELTWDMRAKRVYTDKAIKIRTPDHIIYGVGFDSDEDFSNYTIRKVNGIVSVSDDNSFNNF
ncbi:MAG TPA: LPS export ABC transporter periplasmic protein LptC [Chitinophagales bacterium]|nr:LPS export ABC transporter periplasmic protein LptC [Chitinophagales bacterium]HQO32340.1 LPS export ABC transporter periplasmic protein LptC [Chitinophagales bacterium]HQO89248.1 LPS export ABC transporter periplasmic protein LptC [Chitinophagales bacterium]